MVSLKTIDHKSDFDGKHRRIDFIFFIIILDFIFTYFLEIKFLKSNVLAFKKFCYQRQIFDTFSTILKARNPRKLKILTRIENDFLVRQMICLYASLKNSYEAHSRLRKRDHPPARAIFNSASVAVLAYIKKSLKNQFPVPQFFQMRHFCGHESLCTHNLITLSSFSFGSFYKDF